MKLLSLLILLLSSALLWAGGPDDVEAVNPSGNEPAAIWPETVPDFVRKSLLEAQNNSKPVLVGFGAEWCLPCKAMDKRVFPDPRVAGELENWVTIKIDKDQYPQLAESFSVTGLPIYYVLNRDGKVVDKVAGMQLAIDFAEWLTESREAAQ